MVEFAILGPLEVREDGRPLDLAGTRQRLLLVRLAVSANRVVSLDTLLDDLWGSEATPGAKDALHAQVSRARKALGDPTRLLTKPSGYVLRLGTDELDATRFEVLLAQARSAAAAGDHGGAAALLEEAQHCWRGPALAEFADHAFAQAEAARLEELHLVAAEERAEAELALGRHGPLVTELQAWVRTHRFRERLWRQLMVALYRSGRQADALRAYAEVRSILVEELGIEPGPELARIEEAILLQKPELDWVSPRAPPAGARPAAGSAPEATSRTWGPRSGFIGRQRELALLGSVLEDARSGARRVVLVRGEAGMGKTRMVEELVEEAARRGFRVLAGACTPLGMGGIPLGPVAEALGELAEEDLPLPSLVARLVGASPREGDGDAAEGGQLIGQVLEVLRACTRRQPALMVVEDLHWADATTRELLAVVARSLARSRLLVVGTIRSDDLDRAHALRALLAELSRLREVISIELSPFERDEVAEQLAGILGESPSPHLVDTVFSRAGGNPLFTQELALARRIDTALPRSLHELLSARVERLGPSAAELLQVLAVAGPTAPHDLVVGTSELAPSAALGALHEAVNGQLIAAEGDNYRFRHALFADAVLADLLPAERAGLHARVARWLCDASDYPGGQAARLGAAAVHWTEAGASAEALGASVAAGASAMAVGAPFEAAQHYDRALELWPRVAGAEAVSGLDEVGLLERAAQAHGHAGDLGRADELFLAAIAACGSKGDTVRLGLLHYGRAWHLQAAGRHQDGYASFERAVDFVPAGPPSPARARVLVGLAKVLLFTDRYAEAKSAAGQALDLAVAVGDQEAEAGARNVLGSAVHESGDQQGGLEQLERAVAIAEAITDPEVLSGIFHNHVLALYGVGRYSDAVTAALDHAKKLQRLGLARTVGAKLLCLAGGFSALIGNWGEAERYYQLAASWDPVGEPRFNLASGRADLKMARGHLDEAAEWLDAARESIGVTRPYYVASFHLHEADLANLLGRTWDALEAVRRAYETYRPPTANFSSLSIAARALRLLPDPKTGSPDVDEAAADLMRRFLADVDEVEPLVSGAHEVAQLNLCRAEASRLLCSPNPALWEDSVQRFEALGWRGRAIYARYRYGQALAAVGGDSAVAAATLERAHREACSLGAGPLAASIEASAERLFGSKPGTGAPRPTFGSKLPTGY